MMRWPWEKRCRTEYRLSPQSKFNDRQCTVLNRLLDGFEGKLTTSKYAKLTGCSSDTALRDIRELLEQGASGKAGGRR